MEKSLQKQMFIVFSDCYKCNEPMNVAIIAGDPSINGGQVYGPESFTTDETSIAEKHGVFIQEHFSGTMQETYKANTCRHCHAFVGQHYLFTDYYCAALYGDCEFEKIDLP